MACSICGLEGHNSKTCPQLLLTAQTPNRDDYALWSRHGGLTKEQAKELKRKLEDLVDEIAPDSYGVIAAAIEKRLPERIQQAIKGAQSANKSLEDKSEDE